MILYNKEILKTSLNTSKYINRSMLYLKPSFLLLKSKNEFFTINDKIVGCGIYNNNLIFFFKDADKKLYQLIETLIENKEFVKEFPHNKDIHAVVIESSFINIDAFLEGNYVNIYTKDQVKQLFKPDTKQYKILTKDPGYKEEYIKFLEKCFGTFSTKHTPEQIIEDHTQWDIPPHLNQEVYE